MDCPVPAVADDSCRPSAGPRASLGSTFVSELTAILLMMDSCNDEALDDCVLLSLPFRLPLMLLAARGDTDADADADDDDDDDDGGIGGGLSSTVCLSFLDTGTRLASPRSLMIHS